MGRWRQHIGRKKTMKRKSYVKSMVPKKKTNRKIHLNEHKLNYQ